MKIALFSDIHANLRALEACLADAKAQEATQLAFLGDLVGYGAEPNEVVARIMALSAEGAWVVRGNHDDLAVYPPISERRALGDQGVSWTHDQLTPDQLSFLKALPLTYKAGNILLVHASARDPEKWLYVHDEIQAERSLDVACTDPDIRYVFGGHVHQQTLYYRGTGRGLMVFNPTAGVDIPVPAHRYWIATIGSVGQPRDKKVTAMYALFDSDRQKLCFRRVAYDYVAAAESIRKTRETGGGLPAFFADRLLLGQ